MGRAGKALKQVLESHNISQSQLAIKMGIGRANVHRWANEIRDPSAQTMLEIRDALKKIAPDAADKLIWLYLNDGAKDEDG
ncbi:MAG: helix-turn-helix transcriptional regulator [Microcoleaceae cyanobacterium]